ncbi:hypothetical protein E8E12_008667 [Didymella heteroderae]|uniref:Rhodopsin domain-containing protein n=1 Tax=Didymella heteroderae TaxID=1769908 RepID=A0A9P4WSV7_9PLEO|nr:hypothetical protein E8E12_008667 [Didymella heteroderae]
METTAAMSYTQLVILIWSMWAVALLLTLLRGLTRWHSQRQTFADDYLIFGGMLSLTALTAVITRLLPQFYLAGSYAAAVMQDPTTPMPLPPDVFLERTQTSLKLMFSQMLLFWTTLWAAGCSDPEDLVRADASIKFATSADVIADAVIMILPLNLLRKLQINARQKYGLAMIFSLGTIIIAFAFARLAQVTKATSNAAEDPTTVADGPVLLSMWSHIESSVSVIVATLPAFRYLLNGRIGRTQGRSNTRERIGGRHTTETIGQSRVRRDLSGQWGGNSRRTMSKREEGKLADNDWGSETELRPIQGTERRAE